MCFWRGRPCSESQHQCHPFPISCPPLCMFHSLPCLSPFKSSHALCLATTGPLHSLFLLPGVPQRLRSTEKSDEQINRAWREQKERPIEKEKVRMEPGRPSWLLTSPRSLSRPDVWPLSTVARVRPDPLTFRLPPWAGRHSLLPS